MTSSDKPAKPSDSTREARLAEALRANLRRRKAAKPLPEPASEENKR